MFLIGVHPRLSAFLLTLCLFCCPVHAQDERSVKSPDGQVEFRLFPALPDNSILNCLAYQVWWHGKPVLDTSYLGLDVIFQEPLLGENVGLSSDRPIREAHYNGLWADYLQNSTTGRRLQFEVRVWNDGVAFRYIVPRSMLLFDLAIEDEVTQFHFAGGAKGELPEHAAVPFVREVPGLGWVEIFSQDLAGFPKMELKRFDSGTMVSHLPGGVAEQVAAFKASTPWTGPWRIVVVGADRGKLGEADVVRELGR